MSEDGKQLRVSDGRLFFPALFGRRFEYQRFVLGKEGFSSGRFFYEVQVSGSEAWLLGVVKESTNWEKFLFPSPEDRAWTFSGITTQFQDQHFGNNIVDSATVFLRQRPQTVGVFIDYEKGEVSFNDVDARTLPKSAFQISYFMFFSIGAHIIGIYYSILLAAETYQEI